MDLSEVGPFLHRHPWEIARLKVLQESTQALLEKHVSCLADIGAGDLYVVRNLQSSISEKVSYLAVDKHFQKLTPEGRIKKYRDLTQLSQQSVDMALMMDVLEHMDDDLTFLTEACDKVKEGGYIYITVPAMPSLFSEHDKTLGHYRRYTRQSLVDLAHAARLELKFCHYFFSSLVLFRLLEKILTHKKRVPSAEITSWPYPENSLITRFFVKLLITDATVNRLLSKMHIPTLGLSLGALCQKK